MRNTLNVSSLKKIRAYVEELKMGVRTQTITKAAVVSGKFNKIKFNGQVYDSIINSI